MFRTARNSLLSVFALFAFSGQTKAGEWVENLKIKSLQFNATGDSMTVILARNMLTCGTSVRSFDLLDAKYAKPALLTAFAAGKQLKVYVNSCSGAIPTVTVVEIE